MHQPKALRWHLAAHWWDLALGLSYMILAARARLCIIHTFFDRLATPLWGEREREAWRERLFLFFGPYVLLNYAAETAKRR